MEKITKNDIKWLLNPRNHSKNPPASVRDKTGVKRFLIRTFITLFGLFGLIILPFFLLIRVSVYLNLAHGFAGWAALAGGISAAILLLLVYILLLFRNIRNKKLLFRYSLAGTSTLVLGFCLFSLFYLSGIHAKSPEVRELYRTMHPILRVAVTTVTLADGDLVITDIGRVPADYQRMGLPANPSSLHYIQENGYVHAVDLRTLDRGFIRNALLGMSLKGMGFRTLRHTGTADHLHVELPVKRG